jgi:hypothetical protein
MLLKGVVKSWMLRCAVDGGVGRCAASNRADATVRRRGSDSRRGRRGRLACAICCVVSLLLVLAKATDACSGVAVRMEAAGSTAWCAPRRYAVPDRQPAADNGDRLRSLWPVGDAGDDSTPVMAPLAHLGGRGADPVSHSGAYTFVGIPYEVVVLDTTDPTAGGVVARWPLPQRPVDLASIGSLLAVLMPTEGLRMYDGIDPTAPVMVAQLALPGRAAAIEVVDAVAYIAGAASGLVLLDISNPSAPEILADYDAAARTPVAVAVDGSLAYLIGSGNIEVIDVSDPSAPSQVLVSTISAPEDIIVYDGYGYVASGYLGVNVYDLHAPGGLRLVSTVELQESWAIGLCRVGELLFANDSSNGLYVLDIRDADAPVVLGFVALGGLGRHLVVDQGIAFAPDYFGTGLHIVDVRTPTAPLLVATCTGLMEQAWSATSVATSQERAFVVTTAGLQAVSLGGSGGMGDVTTPWPRTPWSRLLASDDYLYGVGERYSILDPGSAELRVIGEVPTVCTAGRFSDAAAGANGFAVACGHGRVAVVDGSEPASPQVKETVVGGVDLPCIGYDAGKMLVCRAETVRDGTLAYDLLLFDIDRSGEMTRTGSVGLAEELHDVEVRDGMAYVAAGSGLTVLDISGATARVLASVPELGADAPGIQQLLLAGSRLYAACGDRLYLIDVSDVSRPRVVGHYRTTRSIADMTTAGERVLVADHDHGLLLLGVSRTSVPLYLPMALRSQGGRGLAGRRTDIEPEARSTTARSNQHGEVGVPVLERKHAIRNPLGEVQGTPIRSVATCNSSSPGLA